MDYIEIKIQIKEVERAIIVRLMDKEDIEDQLFRKWRR